MTWAEEEELCERGEGGGGRWTKSNQKLLPLTRRLQSAPPEGIAGPSINIIDGTLFASLAQQQQQQQE